jgi:hypothetical protein
MTVKELKEFLATFPDDAIVYRQGDEFKHDVRVIAKVDYHNTASRNIPHNSIVIR